MTERALVSTKKPDINTENLVSRSRKSDGSRSRGSPAGQILFLQRTAGNQAVQRLVNSGTLQTKLRIGQAGDKYEKEADRVAEQVMRMPEPKVVTRKTSSSSVGPECFYCEAEDLRRQLEEEEEKLIQPKSLADQITPVVQRQVEEEEEELQGKATSGHISDVNPDLESYIQSLEGGGHPLSENDRTFFEPRFGQDFSPVRLHTDGAVAELSRNIDARAFTVRNNIFFGAAQFRPGTTAGKHLLAHELTNVVQQGRLSRDPREVSLSP